MMHIMVDLETMSLEPNAALISIGAVKMNAKGEIKDEFYRDISLPSSVEAGLHMDPITVCWWFQNVKAHQNYIGSGHDLSKTLKEFSAWVTLETGFDPHVFVWGNGAMADNVWLSQSYKAVGLNKPWSYKNDRCYRTFRALHWDVKDPPNNKNPHNALSDAIWQANFMENACKEKGLNLE